MNRAIRPRLGVTILEVMIVAAIAAILVAVLYPTLRRSINRASETSCVSNLRQMSLALEMYRSDHGGLGIYGEWTAMGMPYAPVHFLRPYGYDELKARCTGVSFTSQLPRPLYMHMWRHADWVSTVQMYKDDTAIYIDLNHLIPGNSVYSPANRHRVIGVYLGGHVKTRIRNGDPMTVAWWSPSNG